jgi:ADP-heptose:LPS heptosyltransferase
MNEQKSRVLDRWVGVPLCWLLTLMRRLGGLFRARNAADDAPPRKILFVKLAEMGAIVLTMPAFEAARRRVGRENLYILMLANNRQIHDLIDVFDDENLLTIRDDNLWVFARDAFSVLRRCRREGIDVVIDLEGFARVSAVLSYLTGARKRVGMHRYTIEGLYRGDLFTHRIALNYYNHASVQFLTMVEALDAPSSSDVLLKERITLGDYRLPLFEPTDEETQSMRALLRERSGAQPSGPLVVLNCNLIDLLPLRRWPREHYLELGKRILANHPTATLLLTGLPDERGPAEALAREISEQRVVNLAGDTTLRSLVVLCTQVDLLITSDCGTGHMAALTDVRIVSIFGPETPRLYAPLTPHNRSLWAQLACSPCLIPVNHRSSPCRDNVCMQTISVEAVYEAACEMCPALRPRSEDSRLDVGT